MPPSRIPNASAVAPSQATVVLTIPPKLSRHSIPRRAGAFSLTIRWENGGMAACLSAGDIDGFIENGFVRLDDAFPAETAAEARQILWRDAGCDPLDPTT